MRYLYSCRSRTKERLIFVGVGDEPTVVEVGAANTDRRITAILFRLPKELI